MAALEPPPRLALRPGVRVVRRDDRTFQIGFDPGLRRLVVDSDGARPLLESLQRGDQAPPLTRAGRALCRELMDDGLLVDARLLGALPPGPTAARAVAAVVAEAGDRATEVLGRRAASRILVAGAEEWRVRVADLLAPEGVRVAPGKASGSGTAWDVAVLVRLGELDRSHLDDLVRRGVPHLPVLAVDGRVRVGPFVVPGHTACVRCLDAHLGERDPRHAVVVAQYSRLTGRLRTDGVPEPVPSTVWQLALAAAADDVLRFVDGRCPVTWSATLALGGTHGPERTEWRRHPRCGCSWGEGLAVG